MNNKAHLRPKDFDSNGDIIPMACKEEKVETVKGERPKGEYEFIEILAHYRWFKRLTR